ncbi:fumarylacetoacetate hydrolase family protein [Paenibacillus shenyangensis]|uniref:fumarylacetoacetate hydrolase family protein n=1 Tax=Paenibacillus sp. A9 TaxID=1284352 RepID=UPI00036AA670|nr:fumarylacetoacetate hydrolase family protein [Paenibacillus sp. A9]
MKYVHYQVEGQDQLGIQLEKGILPLHVLESALPDGIRLPHTAMELLETKMLHTSIEHLLHHHLSEYENSLLTEDQVQWLPCIPHPGKIICIGLNYRKHAAETNMPEPETPVVFSKFSDSVTAHLADIRIPESAKQLDYEAELCMVIGQIAENVSKENALDYVFGYCTANDLSARDLQMRTSQWLLGKTGAGFAPLGPYLVTADEVGNPNQLGIRAYVNDRQVQSSNTSDMIFHCDELIHYLSRHMTLQPGDIILTGTPEGVIMGLPESERQWLEAGDQVTIEIDRLGRLTNTFVR